MHGAAPEFYWVAETRRELAWRVARYCRRRGYVRRDAWLYSFFTVVGKLPAVVGQLQYHTNQWRGRRTRLIEYKGAATCS